ncbi:MAG: agmatinase [Thermoprotei archaeon]|nr:MAG: agmatinase [Thermoprotei archaeon]
MEPFEIYLSRSHAYFLGFTRRPEETPFTLIGAPLDTTSSYRPGTRFAPLKIRQVSQSLESYSFLAHVDVEDFGFHDAGDVALAQGDVEGGLRAIEEVMRGLFRKDRIVFMLGGEHTVTLSGVKALAERGRRVALLVFDAHADLRDTYLGMRLCHATVTRRAAEVVGADNVLLIGTRAVSQEELEFMRREGIFYITSFDIDRVGVREAAYRVVKRLEGYDEVYLSIDMDVVDPGYAPGVTTPEPFGLHPMQLLRILEKVADVNIRAVDVVELCPPCDCGEATAFLAARLVLELAALLYRFYEK